MTVTIQRRVLLCRRLAALIVVATCAVSAPAPAQDLFEPTIHWAYASYFGTGWYRLSDERSAFVFKTAPRWTLGDAGFDDEGRRSVKYTLRVPLTLGLAQLDFDDLPGTINPGNLSIVTTGLGVDADIPLTQRFSIRPNAEITYGGVLGEDDRAWTYRASMRGRLAFEADGFDWALILDGGFVGYDARRGSSDRFSFVSIGPEFSHPVSWFHTGSDRELFHWHVKYVGFPDRVGVETEAGSNDATGHYWEVGAALGRREGPIRLWFLRFDRLGLAYSTSSGSGDLRGVRVVFRSQYDL